MLDPIDWRYPPWHQEIIIHYPVSSIQDQYHLILQLHKRHCQRQVGVLEELYSGTFYRITTRFPNTLQRSPEVKSQVPHKI